NPELTFNTEFQTGGPSTSADIDISTDGGATWQNAWHRIRYINGPAVVTVPLPMAAHQSAVQVRFHYTTTYDGWWELDNVVFGSRTCDPVPGGIVAGTVTDANTNGGVDGVTVTSADKPAEQATTAALRDDPGLSDGFYWMFSSLAGTHDFTAVKRNYVT